MSFPTSSRWLLYLPSKGMCRVGRYARVIPLFVYLFWDSDRVEESRGGHTPIRVLCVDNIAVLCSHFLGFCSRYGCLNL